MRNDADLEFAQRREKAKKQINQLDKDSINDEPEREAFFNQVYAQAKGDAAFVPWADLKPKGYLLQWLKEHNGLNLSAIDVACGLGDNAQAMADAGYDTTAFDVSNDAVEWAKQRFPKSSVEYQQADLFELPKTWIGQFDLVHECYTLQALPPEMLEATAAAIASLVKPSGSLLVYTRTRKDGTQTNGPPWPLQTSECAIFAKLGFAIVAQENTNLIKNERVIPHSLTHWKRQTVGDEI